MKIGNRKNESEDWDDYDIVESYFDSNSSHTGVDNETTSSIVDIKSHVTQNTTFIKLENDSQIFLRNACSKIDEISEDSQFLRSEKSRLSTAKLTGEPENIRSSRNLFTAVNVKENEDSYINDVFEEGVDEIILHDETSSSIKVDKKEDSELGFNKNVNVIKMDIKFKSDPVKQRETRKVVPSQRILRDEPSEIITDDVLKSFQNVVHEEAKTRAAEQKPGKKFVFGKTQSFKDISTVTDTYEFKYGEVFGKLNKRTQNEKSREIFVKLNGSSMFCYSDKRTTKSRDITESTDMFFTDPTDSKIKYKQELAIELSNSKLYLSTEFIGFLRSCYCGVSNVDKAYLVEINDIILDDVVKSTCSGYIIQYRIGSNRKQLKIQNLEFFIEHNEIVYTFKCAEHKVFMNWLVSILLRQGREVCSFA